MCVPDFIKVLFTMCANVVATFSSLPSVRKCFWLHDYVFSHLLFVVVYKALFTNNL